MCVPTHVFSADVADVENAAVVAVAAAAAAAAAAVRVHVRVRARVRVSSAAARGRARAAVPQAIAARINSVAAAVCVRGLSRVISADSAAEPGRDPEGHGAEAEAPHLC